MTHNLFDNAKFGDMFLTTENKQAVFLRFAENAEYEFAFLYVEDWGTVQVFRHNGKEVRNDVAHSVVRKQKEPVSEDLEQEINAEWNCYSKDGQVGCINRFSFELIARHFANWQKEQDNTHVDNELEAEIDNVRKKYQGFESLCEHDVIEICEHFCKFGAEWQKERTIKKACEYLKDNIYRNLYCVNGEAGFPTAEFIKELRKYLEE